MGYRHGRHGRHLGHSLGGDPIITADGAGRRSDGLSGRFRGLGYIVGCSTSTGATPD